MIVLRVLLGLAAGAWAVFGWSAGLLMGGLGASDWAVACLLGGALAGVVAIVALFFGGPWGALLVIGQIAGFIAASVIITGHLPPPDRVLTPAMIATLLLAGTVAWDALRNHATARDRRRSASR